MTGAAISGQGTVFGLLGPVELVRSGRRDAVGATKQRIALAALLLHPNQAVSADELIEHLWPGGTPHSAPRDARAALHTHIARLRQVLDEERIRTARDGYLIRVGAADVDVARFRDLLGRAGETSDRNTEAALLRAALDLWRGPALADVPSPSLQRDHAVHLAEERLRTLERWLELSLRAGRHEHVVAELRAATTAHPLRERLWAQLMLALYRSGRQAEALHAYLTVAAVLREELGIDPGDELRRLHRAILEADPGLRIPPAGREKVTVRPWQLPQDAAGFTGRQRELRALDGLLDGPAGVAVVTGTAGVGKTALAVHWGHRVRRRFPDGQLYLDLHGFGPGEPLSPVAALEVLLQALNVPTRRIPAGLQARSALLRSALTGRRLLMVLDNARDAAQVRPLLPGSDAVAVLTSRDRLRGLSVHGRCSHLTLGVFSPEESATLLTSLLGPGADRAEHEARSELGRLCAQLPLALRIAAAAVAHDPHQSVRGYADALRRGDRLTALRLDEHTGVRESLERSYTALPPAERDLFRLLGLVPGADFTAGTAAALCGVRADLAARWLARLADRNLVEQYAPARYRWHDLLRLYAVEQCTAQERAAAVARMHEWYPRGCR
ncbi:AfsR/SARP family transcriptional regulator [Nonomuraea longicatena]